MTNTKDTKRLLGSSRFLIVLSAILISFGANAQVTVPNTHTAGTPAVAAEVNANNDALAAAINAMAGVTSTADVTTFFLPDGSPAAGDITGSGSLTRTASGLTLSASTTGLDADSGYTLWWIIFNNPAACAAACMGPDLGTPAVEGSVMNATGRNSDANGEATFSAFLPVGYMHSADPNGRQLFGPGVQDAMGAEIHIVIKNHGPATGNFEQLSTDLADCNHPVAPAGCYDSHAMVFPLPVTP